MEDRLTPRQAGVANDRRGLRRQAHIGSINHWGLLVVPALVFLGIFFAYPAVAILARSLTEFSSPQHGGLDNYTWFFGSSANVKVLVRTLTTAGIVTAVCLLLGYPYAYLMTTVSRRWRLVMVGLVLLPFWTSLMVRNYAWIILLQDNGVLNDALAQLGIGPVKLLGSVRGVTIGMAQVLLPFMILPLYTTLQGIDRRLLLAAQGLGAKPAVAFLRVYLPLSAPGVFAGALLVFVLSLGFYITPALLGSPSDSLLSQLLVTQVSELLAWGRGGAMAAVLLVVTLAFLWLSARLGRVASRRGGPSATDPSATAVRPVVGP